jgi:hypothetical protein
VGNDRVVGFNPDEPNKSGIFKLPGGEMVEQFPLPTGKLTVASDRNMLLVRPLQKYAVGVFDLTKKSVAKGNVLDAFDILGDTFVAERETGRIGVFTSADDKLIKDTTLPAGTLGPRAGRHDFLGLQMARGLGAIRAAPSGILAPSGASRTSAGSTAPTSTTPECFLPICPNWAASPARFSNSVRRRGSTREARRSTTGWPARMADG